MAEGLRLPGARRAALCLFLICLVSGTPRLSAQQISATRSKEKVPIFHVFEPSKNETVTSVGPLDDGTFAQLAILSAATPSPVADSTRIQTRFALRTAYYVYAGKSPTRPQNVSFEFTAGVDEGKHEEGLDFSFSVEGQQIYQGKTVYGRSLFPTGYILMQTAEIPTEFFLLVAQSRKARFQIGRRSYELGGGQRKHLR
jgi:hypothetical protein